MVQLNKKLILSSFILSLCLSGQLSAEGKDPPPTLKLDEATIDKLLDYELQPGEEYIAQPGEVGTAATERAIFEHIAGSLSVLHKKIETDKRDGANGRAFHFKAHGCLTGKLKIYDQAARVDDKLNETNVGFFSKGGEYDLIARISNGMGWWQHDAKPDLRSMTLKVFPDKTSNQTFDWTLMNGPVPFARDILQFEPFMFANLKGPAALFAFILEQVKKDPEEADYFNNFNRAVFGVINSMMEERYWSQHPFTLGKKSFMKVIATPEKWTAALDEQAAARGSDITPATALSAFLETGVADLFRGENYLREDLIKKVKGVVSKESDGRPVKYFLELQVYKDSKKTPVENTLVEWKEKDSKPIRVGEIVFDKQDIDVPARDAECELLKFTPANHLADHRAAGSLGRGRLLTYKMGQLMRGAIVTEPNANIVDRWRKGNYLPPVTKN